MYSNLDFDREELSKVMREHYDELIAFITQPAFRALHAEMMALPPAERPAFVMDQIVEPEALAARGIVVPEGILIQTSAFGDRRPTLFAVKKFLPEKYHVAWENVNWTFNNEYIDADVTRDPALAWRPPLPVTLQNDAIARELDIETIPLEAGINSGMFERAVETEAV
jgi:hypothetical protein